MKAASRILSTFVSIVLLAGCGGSNDGALDVALIGTQDAVFTDSARLSIGAQHLRAATDSGLVTFNAQGETVPALAERWIVTEDGLSFIFRLRDTTWPDGSPMTGESARAALLSAIGQLEGTSLALDLAPIEEIRAMAGRVIEIRLTSPEPYLLTLLAQPELALRRDGGGTGPMVLDRIDEAHDGGRRQIARLDFKPPQERGLPIDENWEEDVRQIDLFVVDEPEAIRMFDAGEVELVLGGDLGGFPLVDTGPLATGTLRVDSPVGLFGLQVRSETGLLGNEGVREGIAMAIDREALLARYNVGGWNPTTRPVSPGLPGDPGLVSERWLDMDIEDRRTEASARISAWRRQFDDGDTSQPVVVTVALQEGPGWDLLLQNLANQLAGIGITIERAESRAQAQLVVIDRIARFPAPRWFLNQFNCTLRRGLCSEEVDALVAQALAETDTTARAMLMAQAEAEFTLENVYIPIGSPLRWSLLRGSVDGFEANPHAFHPLPPLAEIPR
ncbi:ABC transporter substrate-binding protein [Aurantiacibacter marinus]|uniref:Solute-binding protein family 5 domain-containing protein n=1 Tax=Aurantiacibacter marinus TaxID=874156 RepID=A0A0H0XSC8_9SPHN|nr:ABC transporter substrate-binding protein [Aurantiacibacter marinus]KLI64881.1 hypothetical protein AAV99_05080 [Aurantiacibacter marinus]